MGKSGANRFLTCLGWFAKCASTLYIHKNIDGVVGFYFGTRCQFDGCLIETWWTMNLKAPRDHSISLAPLPFCQCEYWD